MHLCDQRLAANLFIYFHMLTESQTELGLLCSFKLTVHMGTDC